MAGIAVTPGTGATVAGDLISSESHTLVKVEYGAAGSATPVTPTSGLPIQGSSATATSASWTSATTVNTAVSIGVGGMNVVSVALIATSTFTGGVISFEVSIDNTNWIPVMMARIDSYTTETTYTIVASTNRAWSTSVDGFNYFRVRLSTAITGTGTAAVSMIPQTFAIEPIVNVGQSTAANLQATIGTALPTGGNTIGAVNVATRTTGGATTFTLISAATTNATLVKASAGTVYGIQASNTGASVAFLKIFNLAAAPTVGTSVAAMTLIIPAGGGITVPVSAAGLAFGTGISISITGLAATADTTAVALSQVVANLQYA